MIDREYTGKRYEVREEYGDVLESFDDYDEAYECLKYCLDEYWPREYYLFDNKTCESVYE